MKDYFMTYTYLKQGHTITTFYYFYAEDITDAKEKALCVLKERELFAPKGRKLLWVEEENE